MPTPASRRHGGTTLPQFHELLSASGGVPVRALIESLDGCTGGRAGEIVAMARLGRMACHDLDAREAARLLEAARAAAKPANPKRLGAVGPGAFPGRAYAIAYGSAPFGSRLRADIPVAVEVWASQATGNVVAASVNRTPIAGEMALQRDKSEVNLFGCGLRHTVANAPKELKFNVWLNITAPYMPITSDGKEPDLRPVPGASSAPPWPRRSARSAGQARASYRKRTWCSTISKRSSKPSAAARTLPVQFTPVVLCAAPDRERGDRQGIADRQLQGHPRRLRERARRNRADVPRAARLDHPSAPRRDDHARHPDGREVRAARLELQQAALHREGGRAGGAQAGPLARAARLRRHVVEGLLDPRGARPDRQAGRA